MRLLGRCDNPGCGRLRLFVRRRSHILKNIGKVSSKTLMCGRCYRRVKAIVRAQNSESAS